MIVNSNKHHTKWSGYSSTVTWKLFPFSSLQTRLGNKCFSKCFSPCFEASKNLLEQPLLTDFWKARELVFPNVSSSASSMAKTSKRIYFQNTFIPSPSRYAVWYRCDMFSWIRIQSHPYPASLAHSWISPCWFCVVLLCRCIVRPTRSCSKLSWLQPLVQTFYPSFRYNWFLCSLQFSLFLQMKEKQAME